MIISINTLIIVAIGLILAFMIILLFPIIKIHHTSSVWRHPPEDHLPDLTHNLYRHVAVLSREIGSRSLREYDKIGQAQNYIETFLQGICFPYELQSYVTNGKTFSNMIATLPGSEQPAGNNYYWSPL